MTPSSMVPDAKTAPAVLRADWPEAPPRVRALTTLRSGGVSPAPYGAADGAASGLNLGTHVGDAPDAVQANRARLQLLLPGAPRWLEQVHGVAVCDADALQDPAPVPQADASVSARAGVVCAILTADCLPVLFCDTRGEVVGAAHAGWRGLAGGVLQATVARLRERTNNEILAWLGPAIGPQCFEVGAEVRTAFAGLAGGAAAFVALPGSDSKYLADIYLLARLALATVAVTRVAGGGLCTVSDAARFYSYRRDRVTGRMASLIWLD